METRMAKLEERVDHIGETVEKIDKKIDKLDERFRLHELEPAESWKKLKWLVITLAVTTLITLVATILGLTGGI